jgi:hypothetical protein
MNKKICFVVHRYAPYPGGSEYYVQQMAEECVQRHLDVTVIAGEHKGHLNGVRVTSDANELMNKDLMCSFMVVMLVFKTLFYNMHHKLIHLFFTC